MFSTCLHKLLCNEKNYWEEFEFSSYILGNQDTLTASYDLRLLINLNVWAFIFKTAKYIICFCTLQRNAFGVALENKGKRKQT